MKEEKNIVVHADFILRTIWEGSYGNASAEIPIEDLKKRVSEHRDILSKENFPDDTDTKKSKSAKMPPIKPTSLFRNIKRSNKKMGSGDYLFALDYLFRTEFIQKKDENTIELSVKGINKICEDGGLVEAVERKEIIHKWQLRF